MKSSSIGVFRFALLSLVVLLGVSFSCQAADKPTHASRHIYCNVYLDTMCFGIAGGDTLDMTIPEDFVLYSISLGTDVKAQIYSGYNPQDDGFASAVSKPCAAIGNSGKCVYVFSNGSLDLLYQANANASSVHIHLTGVKPSNVEDINDFLANFRGCKQVDQLARCTNERIFKYIAL